MVTSADVARQAIDLSKATFDNVYLSLAGLQHLAEQALVDVASGSSWVPPEVADIVREWVGFAERTRGDLKDTADRCHALMHDLVDRAFPPAGRAQTGDASPRAAALVH